MVSCMEMWQDVCCDLVERLGDGALIEAQNERNVVDPGVSVCVQKIEQAGAPQSPSKMDRGRRAIRICRKVNIERLCDGF